MNILESFFSKGNKRTLLAKKNIFISFFIKFFGMIVAFSMVSVSIKYLGKENYGIWVVLSGLIAWSNVFDLGFSHGLRNRLAEARANNKIEDERYYVSTTYAFLLLIAFIMFIVFMPLFMYVDWQSILNTKAVDNASIQSLILIIFSFFLLQFILKPISSIFEAYQWPAISQAIGLFSGTIALLGVIFLIYIGNNKFLLFAYAVTGTPVFILFFVSIYFYRQKFLYLLPSFRYVQKKYFKSIAGLGISFFVIQLSVLVIFQSDNMIISYLFGPKEVTNYNIVYRYFSIVIIVFGVIMGPFWTAFTEAYQKEDFSWIQKTMKILLSLLLGSVLLSVALLLMANRVYSLWINQDIDIPNTLSVLMAFYVVLFSFHNIVAFFSNGIGKIKIQLWVSILAALLNLPLSYFFGKVLELGTSGVLLATISCLMLVDIVLFVQYKKIITGTSTGVWDR